MKSGSRYDGIVLVLPTAIVHIHYREATVNSRRHNSRAAMRVYAFGA